MSMNWLWELSRIAYIIHCLISDVRAFVGLCFLSNHRWCVSLRHQIQPCPAHCIQVLYPTRACERLACNVRAISVLWRYSLVCGMRPVEELIHFHNHSGFSFGLPRLNNEQDHSGGFQSGGCWFHCWLKLNLITHRACGEWYNVCSHMFTHFLHVMFSLWCAPVRHHCPSVLSTQGLDSEPVWTCLNLTGQTQCIPWYARDLVGRVSCSQQASA